MGSSGSTSSEPDYYCDEFYNKILNCPQCKGRFEKQSKAKILPNCGHSMCQACIKEQLFIRRAISNMPHTVECPTCHVVSQIGKEGVRSNFALAEAVAQINKRQLALIDAEPSNDDRCKHVALVDDPITCEHCSTKFCNDCLLRHLEKVRVTAVWHSSNFSERWKPAHDWAKANFAGLKEKVQSQVDRTAMEIMAASQELEHNLLAAVRQAREQLLNEVEESSKETLAKIESFMANSNFDSLIGVELDKVSNLSLLQLSNEEIQQAYQHVQDVDEKLILIETLNKNPEIFGEITFRRHKADFEDFATFARKSLGSVDKTTHLSNSLQELLPSVPLEVHRAARCGDLAAIKAAFESTSPFCQAMALQHGDPSDDDKTVLHQAAERGQLDVVEFLIDELNADVLAKCGDEFESLPIHLAADNGHLNVIRFFIQRRPELNKVEDNLALCPLHRAARENHIDVVRFFGNKTPMSADHANDRQRTTALMVAAAEGNLEICVYLVERLWADITAVDADGVWPLSAAIESGNFELVKYFCERKPVLVCDQDAHYRYPVHTAATCGNLEILKFLYEKSINKPAKLRRYDEWIDLSDIVNAMDEDGCTPIMLAARAGHLEAVRFLVDKGSVLRIENDFSRTVIHEAAAYGQLDVVAYLVERFPVLARLKSSNKKTPIQIARKFEQQDVVDFLRQKLLI